MSATDTTFDVLRFTVPVLVLEAPETLRVRLSPWFQLGELSASPAKGELTT